MFAHVVDVLPSDANGINYKMLAAEEEAIMRERLAPVFERVEADEAIPGCSFALRVGRVGETLMEELGRALRPRSDRVRRARVLRLQVRVRGGVSKYLVRESRCDVLVVKAE